MEYAEAASGWTKPLYDGASRFCVLKSTVKRGVRLFWGLEKLFVLPQEARAYKPIRRTEAERVRGEIVEFLVREKENSPELVRELPSVTIIIDQ